MMEHEADLEAWELQKHECAVTGLCRWDEERDHEYCHRFGGVCTPSHCFVYSLLNWDAKRKRDGKR
jgi:hypothetical protein